MMIILALCTVHMARGEDASSHIDHGNGYNAAHETDKLSLDHGAKWKMDSHTRAMFASMSERIQADGDLKEVGAGINEDLHKLIQGCSMTGAAHDQLHLFLAPYIPAVTELSHKGTESAFQKVKHMLYDYQNYFE